MSDRYLISIASYRRPDQLNRLLDSLESSIDPDRADIVVVDNDAAQTARDVSETHRLPVRYLVEPEPGIASARNAGLRCFSDDYIAIIFVDDDEWVSANWFEMLTTFSDTWKTDVVNGPVITELPDDAPAWVRKGGFFQRPLQASGLELLSAATNNTLLYRQSWERAGRPVFDTAFSTTGGSDWDFFWTLRKSGAVIRFAADVIVHEDVPPSRLSARWIRQRAIRNGIVNTRVRLKHNEAMVLPLGRGLLRMAFNSALIARDLVTRRGFQAKPVNAVLHEYGKFAGLAGKRIHEYKRS